MFNHEPAGYICPLCQIVRGEATERGNQEDSILHRDEVITVFIAGKWWKSNPGHVIIIPNQHVENLYDISEEAGHKIFDYSKKVAVAFKNAYQCDGVSTRQHNEPAGNQDVWHYHLHIFPRYAGDNLYQRHAETFWPTPEERKPYVEKLKKFL